MNQSLALIGFSSGLAARNVDCALGPWYLYYHPELFAQLNFTVQWQSMIETTASARGREALPFVEENTYDLGCAILPFAWERKPFCVIGGDHSCAMGTWSAVAYANRQHGDIGLIWIDAHMDSHTPLTTESHNIHGMPVAHLLGEGTPSLCQIFDRYPKLKPHNLVIIGVRSYESGEAELLARLGVKVVFMQEIEERGLDNIMNEASEYVCKTTCGFGISVDLDAVDPYDAPGVGSPEPNGIQGSDLVQALGQLISSKPLLGLEIAEYNPIKDKEAKTAKLVTNIIQAVYEL